MVDEFEERAKAEGEDEETVRISILSLWLMPDLTRISYYLDRCKARLLGR
jgi:hypothetical protein